MEMGIPLPVDYKSIMSVRIKTVTKTLPQYSRSTTEIVPFFKLWLQGQEERFVKKLIKMSAIKNVKIVQVAEFTRPTKVPFLLADVSKFEKVTNVEGLEKFATSLGWKFLRDSWKDVILKLESRNGTKAVVGCPHFCATYKREVFDNLPKSNSIYKILGDSEYLYTDLPVLKNDGYRLATDNNYAFHLGNVFESWMQVAFDEITPQSKEIKNYSAIKISKRNYLSYWVKNVLFVRILKFRFVKLYLFKSKGLTSTQINNFTS